MEIRRKQVKDLTQTEYRACYLANYRENGYMQETIRLCRERGREGQVVMLWDGPDDKITSLIGWVLLTPVQTGGTIGVNRYIMRKSKYTAQFWVKRQYRKQGYATRLMTEVKKIDSNPHVFPHDKASGELFSNFKVQCFRDDKSYLRKKPRVA